MPSDRVLGKRKRRPAEKAEANTDAAALEDAQAIFRRHFEAQFAPLDDEKEAAGSGKAAKGNNLGADADQDGDGPEDMRSDSESGEDDEWDGLSGGDGSSEEDQSNGEGDDASSASVPNGVEVVDHSKPTPAAVSALQAAMMSKREMRAYLSSRPPDTTASTDLASTKKKGGKAGGADDDDADDPHNEDSKTLLANDLALQRLISESHILSASNPFNSVGSTAAADGGSGSGSGQSFTEGRTRKLTTDLRLQKLGSKESIFTQQKMPMGMRQGIATAKQAREDKRRREAKENGIILETAQKKKGGGAAARKAGSKMGRGDVAVDMPGMGKFRNGELRLSTREVKAVEMEGKRFDSGGKKRRRRR